MNYKFKTKPFEHQLDALEASCNKEVFAYLWKWVLENLRFY
jgi:hypothetical protein